MENFWPTEMAKEMMPAVAEGMNKLPKIAFSERLSRQTGTTRLY
jgi:hypothetical protein